MSLGEFDNRVWVDVIKIHCLRVWKYTKIIIFNNYFNKSEVQSMQIESRVVMCRGRRKWEGWHSQAGCKVSVRPVGSILKTYRTAERLPFPTTPLLTIAKMWHRHPKRCHSKVSARCAFANYLDWILQAYASIIYVCAWSLYMHRYTHHGLTSYMFKLG